MIAVALAGCGAGEEAAPAASLAPEPSTSITAPAPAPAPAASVSTSTATTPRAAAPSSVAPATSTSAARPAVALGPEWTQRDGRVLIEATASGDARVLLRDLEALGLRDGVAFGRVVNGWLPVESFPAAQRLASLAFVRPAGAGTG